MKIDFFRILKKVKILPATFAACLMVAAFSYTLPAIRVIASPIGSVAWSVQDIVRTIPKGIFQPAKKPNRKINDFVDLLMKIIPKDENKKPVKISLTFIYLMLIPVAIAFAYLGIIMQAIFLLLKKYFQLKITAAATALSAAYSLFGIYFLGIQAKIAFTNAVDRIGQGKLGFISKYFVEQVAVSADKGAYILLASTALAFLISVLMRKR